MNMKLNLLEPFVLSNIQGLRAKGNVDDRVAKARGVKNLSAKGFSSQPCSRSRARISFRAPFMASCLIGLLLSLLPVSAVPYSCGNDGALRRKVAASKVNARNTPIESPSANAVPGFLDWNSPIPQSESSTVRRKSLTPSGPPNLTLSPSSVTTRFFGSVQVDISNLAAGSTVRIERFQVNNANGEIDSNAMLQGSYVVTDGAISDINGTVNSSIVADSTGPDGAIRARLNYLDPFVQNMAGEYVVRVSSPSGSFAPISQRLSVAPEPYAQKVRGHVRTGGTVVPNAYVALITASGEGGRFAGGVIADSDGQFEIQAPDGRYSLIATRPGLVGKFARSARFRLKQGATQDSDIELTPGTRKISGRLFDLSDPVHGLAGIQVLALTQDEDAFAIAYTDFQGNWSMSVTPGVWQIVVLPQAIVASGYVGLYDDLFVDAEDGDATGLDIRLPKADRLVRGTVRNASNQRPVSGAAVILWSEFLDYYVRVVSDADGNYAAPVTAGAWFQAVDPESASESGFAGSRATLVDPSSTNQLESNHFLVPAVVDIEGIVVDEDDDPVEGVIVRFLPVDRSDHSVVVMESDEYGEIWEALPEGLFQAKVDLPNSFVDLIAVETPPFEARLGGVPEPKIVMKFPTSYLKVYLEDSSGEPLVDFPLSAEASINNTIHRTFAYTDEDGYAELGVIDGQWTIRFDFDRSDPEFNLATYGYQPLANRIVTVANEENVEIEVGLTALPPTLTVKVANDRLRLSWPWRDSAYGFRLETAPSVLGPWATVPAEPVETFTDFTLDVDRSGPSGYFRLRAP